MKETEADVMALQEVFHVALPSALLRHPDGEGAGTQLDRLLKYLPGASYAFGPACGAFGNAVLTTKRIVDFAHCTLIGRVDGEPRGIMKVDIECLPGKILRIFNLHLDHHDEKERLGQLEHVFEFIAAQSAASPLPHLLLGDFNSLCRADYNDAEWKKIADVRFKNWWEAPRSDVIEAILKRGYQDLYRKSPERKGDVATCWAETRIDFIFASPDFPHPPISLHHLSENTTSDHSPVLLTLDLSFS